MPALAVLALAQAHANEAGVPVTDPVVIVKCGSCHARDSQGNMQRISWERATPEGWQEALKRMVLVEGLSLTPAEARSIVKYLSDDHGLAPEEAKTVSYSAERRMHQENTVPDDRLEHACARCHSFARALSWRRSLEDWKQFAADHAARYKLPANEEAVAFLARTAPLHTPQWDAWSTRAHVPNLEGRWLVTASLRGHGKYYGDMLIGTDAGGEFVSRVRLTSLSDGSFIARSGRGVVYAGYAWRGRSQGLQEQGAAPDSALSQAREVLWISPDQSSAQGRWFWGEYQEFGFDVQLHRAGSDPSLLTLDRTALKAASEGNRVRLIGDHLPEGVSAADLDFGPGITVQRIVSSHPGEIVAELDVASGAALGRRDVRLRAAILPAALAIYDRIDYIKVAPDSAMAAFSDASHGAGYQQFEAIAYQRGPDGRSHTADDVELGPVDAKDVDWSLEVFYAAPGSSTDHVGKISATGFFTPAAKSPNANFDVWVVATAKNEKDKNGKPLVGKSYMVVTVSSYTLNGRRYVRDLDRWVDDGAAK